MFLLFVGIKEKIAQRLRKILQLTKWSPSLSNYIRFVILITSDSAVWNILLNTYIIFAFIHFRPIWFQTIWDQAEI